MIIIILAIEQFPAYRKRDSNMKKYYLFTHILFFLFSFTVHPLSLDHSFALGFNGIYKEDSWTPLIIRLSNDGKSISGKLIVEIDNSSSAFEQKRRYVKPVDLPSGSQKAVSFVLPLGYYSKDIKYYYESEKSILLENTIQLRQKGIKSSLILGISPFPDLGFLSKNSHIGSQVVTYPHIDNLPTNSNAYNAVEYISIHREMMERLSAGQFKAISRWVSSGGILVIWGGKSPSQSKWDYLPAHIIGIKKINPNNALSPINNSSIPDESIVINILETSDENRLYSYGENDLITRKTSGLGFVYFIGFDYSGSLKNWPGLNTIWDIIFEKKSYDSPFPIAMRKDFLLEDYIALIDNSGFNYLNRKNVALILFLSASVSISLLIYIYLRKKSKNLTFYTFIMFIVLLLLSLFIFISLYNDRYRKDCYVISSNLIYSSGSAEHSLFFRDILIGSSNRTSSDLTLYDDSQSILKQEKNENLIIEETPELIIRNIEMNLWSSRIFRFERSIDNFLAFRTEQREEQLIIKIENKSDYFIHNSFIYHRGFFQYVENIMPGESLSFPFSDIKNISQYTSSNSLSDVAINQYLSLMGDEKEILFGGLISTELYPVEFSNRTWRKKNITLILATDTKRGTDE